MFNDSTLDSLSDPCNDYNQKWGKDEYFDFLSIAKPFPLLLIQCAFIHTFNVTPCFMCNNKNNIIGHCHGKQTAYVCKCRGFAHANIYGVRGRDVSGAYRAHSRTTFIFLWHNPKTCRTSQHQYESGSWMCSICPNNFFAQARNLKRVFESGDFYAFMHFKWIPDMYKLKN